MGKTWTLRMAVSDNVTKKRPLENGKLENKYTTEGFVKKINI